MQQGKSAFCKRLGNNNNNDNNNNFKKILIIITITPASEEEVLEIIKAAPAKHWSLYTLLTWLLKTLF